MTISEILSHCDHTLLKQEAAWDQIRALCDEGMKYHTASVCIPPAWVGEASRYLAGRLPVCTVIGFPNGYSTTAVKVFETREAVEKGADEIDMVVNLGSVKDGRWEDLLSEMQAVRSACPGKILKVIIETCLLTQEEKLTLCRLVTQSGADYIKTSTGFSTGGATREDVALLRANVGPQVKVKAAGGISSLEDARDFLALGAERLGTSRIVRIAKEAQAHE